MRGVFASAEVGREGGSNRERGGSRGMGRQVTMPDPQGCGRGGNLESVWKI